MKKVKYLLFILMLASCSQNTSTSYNSSSPSIENTISTSSNLISSTDDVSSSSSSVSSSSSSTSLNLSTTTKDSTFSSSEVIQSPIASLEAIHELVEIKYGETSTTENCYEIKGFETLTEEQKEVKITSSDPKVLKISEDYKTMTALDFGHVVVTVVSKEDSTKRCDFIVRIIDTVKSLEAKYDLVELKIGLMYNAPYYYEIKGYKELTEKQKEVTITSSNPEVLKISEDYKIMEPLSVGSSVVTVISKDNPTKSCSFTAEIIDPGAIRLLEANVDTFKIKVGETVETDDYFTIEGYKTLTATQKKVTITSSNPEVLKISEDYKTMTALSIGSAVITVVSDEDPTKSCSFTAQAYEVIKSLEANAESFDIKVGETVSAINYYTLVGYKSLTAKQKKVTITSSNPEVLTISSNNQIMTALSIGSAVVTVVSQEEPTKYCTFTVNVTDSFFDREIASMSPSWDLTHENDEINPYIKIDTDLSSGIFAKEIDDTKWFIETEITIHSFLYNEQNSKVGIVTNTFNNKDLPNKIFYYLNTPMSNENEWNTFGVTELKSIEDLSTSIGPRTVITKENENVYSHDELITYDKTFKMGMLRDNLNFYLYVNGNYIYTFEATSELFDLTPSKVGFFSFSTEITFSNYYIIKDEVKINEMIELI